MPFWLFFPDEVSALVIEDSSLASKIGQKARVSLDKCSWVCIDLRLVSLTEVLPTRKRKPFQWSHPFRTYLWYVVSIGNRETKITAYIASPKNVTAKLRGENCLNLRVLIRGKRSEWHLGYRGDLNSISVLVHEDGHLCIGFCLLFLSQVSFSRAIDNPSSIAKEFFSS